MITQYDSGLAQYSPSTVLVINGFPSDEPASVWVDGYELDEDSGGGTVPSKIVPFSNYSAPGGTQGTGAFGAVGSASLLGTQSIYTLQYTTVDQIDEGGRIEMAFYGDKWDYIPTVVGGIAAAPTAPTVTFLSPGGVTVAASTWDQGPATTGGTLTLTTRGAKIAAGASVTFRIFAAENTKDCLPNSEFKYCNVTLLQPSPVQLITNDTKKKFKHIQASSLVPTQNIRARFPTSAHVEPVGIKRYNNNPIFGMGIYLNATNHTKFAALGASSPETGKANLILLQLAKTISPTRKSDVHWPALTTSLLLTTFLAVCDRAGCLVAGPGPCVSTNLWGLSVDETGLEQGQAIGSDNFRPSVSSDANQSFQLKCITGWSSEAITCSDFNSFESSAIDVGAAHNSSHGSYGYSSFGSYGIETQASKPQTTAVVICT